MENETEFWVLTYANDLVSADLNTLTFTATGEAAIAAALNGAGVTTIAVAEADILAQLQTDPIQGAAHTNAGPLASLAETDSTLFLYRFSADGTGITSRRLVGDDAVFGTDGNDTLTATSSDDEVYLQEGNDTILDLSGQDSVFGGAGTDTVGVAGLPENYTLTLSADWISVDDRRDPNDGIFLRDVEKINFSGGQYEVERFGGLTSLTAEEISQFVELYIAYFNRAPDALGLGFWGTAFANGVTLEQTAALFIDQDETRALYPDTLSNAEFATMVYTNVLGRAADQAGFDFWVGVLDNGFVSRDQFILEVLRGAKAEPPAGADQTFIDQQLADRAFLSTKTDIGTYFAITQGMSNVANASAAMALYDGSQSSLDAAVAAINTFFIEANDANSGEFLVTLFDVVENPFPVNFKLIDNVYDAVEDTPLIFNVLENDIGTGLEIESFSDPLNGRLELVGGSDGPLRYIPEDDFVGTDTFLYTAIDSEGRGASARVTINVAGDADIGDTPATAQILTVVQSITSEIETNDDVDFFQVNVTPNTTYSIFLDTDFDSFQFMILTDPAGDPLVVTERSLLTYLPDAGRDTFYIGVSRDSPQLQIGQPDYTLSVSEINPFADIPDNSSTPVYVDLSGDGTWRLSEHATLGQIEQAGDVDWIGFAAEGGGRYGITVDGADQLDVDVIIRNAAGNFVTSSSGFGDEIFVFEPPSAAGLETFYIEVYGYANTVGVYEVIVSEII